MASSQKNPWLIALAAVVVLALLWVRWPSNDIGHVEEEIASSRKTIATVKSRMTHTQAARQTPREFVANKDKSDAEPPESEQEPLFEVNGKRFRSLAEAVDAANPGDTITLTGDAYVRNPVKVRKSLRLDLNGFRLTARNSRIPRIRRANGDRGAGGHAISIQGAHDVIIENGFIDVDSNGGKNGFTGAVENVPDPQEPNAQPETVAEAEHPEDANYDVVVRDVEVTSDVMRSSAFLNSDGTMLIDNCKVASNGGNGSYTVGADAKTTIRDCEFNTVGEEGWGGWWNNTVAVAFDGTTVVESGTYVTKMAEGAEGTAYGTYVFSSGGTIEVRNGEFVADNVVQADKDMNNYGTDFGASEVVIRDGAFSGKMESVQVGEESVVMSGASAYGGVYDQQPKQDFVPEGKSIVAYGDGTYSVENTQVR